MLAVVTRYLLVSMEVVVKALMVVSRVETQCAQR